VRPITIRHLLTHTAGLGYTIVQQGPIMEEYRRHGLNPVTVSRLPTLPGLTGPRARSLDDFANRLGAMPLVHQPGTRWSYSVSLDLIGRVIEVVAGQPFDAFLQERVLDPCGMTSTFFTVPMSERARFSTNYFDLLGVPLPIDTAANSLFYEPPPFPFGGAGLVSSARDYDRFLQMLAGYGMLEGRRVMSEAAVRLATSNLLPDTLAPGGAFREGFGFGAGGLVGQGEADGLFGWFGAASTAGLVNMRTGLRHTLMTQLVGAGVEALQERFPRAVAQDAAARVPA
jgi:CubicO group peptidase (beta-lactamase class C family)